MSKCGGASAKVLANAATPAAAAADDDKDHSARPTWGGGSIKWNKSKFWTPSDLSSKTTLDRFVLWISGTVAINISSLYWRWVYSR